MKIIKNNFFIFLLIVLPVMGGIFPPLSTAQNSSPSPSIKDLQKEYETVERNIDELEEFIQEREEGRIPLERLAVALKETERLKKRLEELDKLLEKVKSEDLELPQIQIAGTLKDYGGEPLNKPVENGQILAFQAKAEFPKDTTAQKRGLVWEIFDKDNKSFLSKTCHYDIEGQAIKKGSDEKCKTQADANYDARLRFKIDHFHPGRYQVKLKHWLLDDPEQKTESLYVFAVEEAKFEIRGLVIHGSREADAHLTIIKNVGKNYFPHYESKIDLFGYAYYTLPTSIEEVTVSLKITDQKTGEVLAHSEGSKKRLGDPLKERAGIPIPKETLKPGQKAYLEFSVTSPEGETLTKKIPFAILMPKVKIKELIVSDNTTAKEHLPVLLPNQIPHLFVYYSVPEGIDEVDIYLGVAPRKGDPLFSKKFKKKIKGDRTKQRAGIRLDTIKVPPNKKWFFQAQIKDPDGRDQYKFREFSVRGMTVTLDIPKRLQSGDSAKFRINVSPNSLQPPFDISVDTTKELILAYSPDSFKGTLTGAAFDYAGTGRITVTVKKDGQVATAKGRINVGPAGGGQESVVEFNPPTSVPPASIPPPTPSFNGIEGTGGDSHDSSTESSNDSSESRAPVIRNVVTYHDNAKTKIKQRYQTKNGLRHGKYERFSDEGKKMNVANYVDGELEGQYLHYYLSGPLHNEYFYRQGKPHGLHTQYGSNGKKKLEENLIDGVLQGDWKDYDTYGRLDSFGKYVNDKEEGEWKKNFYKGKTKTIVRYIIEMYKNGKMLWYKHYKIDGTLIEETIFDENGNTVSTKGGKKADQKSDSMTGSGNEVTGTNNKNEQAKSTDSQNKASRQCATVQKNLAQYQTQTNNAQRQVEGIVREFFKALQAKLDRLKQQAQNIGKQIDQEILRNAKAPPPGKSANLINNKYMSSKELARYGRKRKSQVVKIDRERNDTIKFYQTKVNQANLSVKTNCGRLVVDLSTKGIGSEGVSFNKANAMSQCKILVNATMNLRREQQNLKRYNCASASVQKQPSTASDKNKITKPKRLEERRKRRR
jgi:antitoxin component YwqK of YwqJK toxin-antitoxin module